MTEAARIRQPPAANARYRSDAGKGWNLAEAVDDRKVTLGDRVVVHGDREPVVPLSRVYVITPGKIRPESIYILGGIRTVKIL